MKVIITLAMLVFVVLLFCLMGRGCGEALTPESEKAEALISELRSATAERRLSAAKQLGQFGYKAAAPELIRALEDVRDDVKRAAAAALGQLRDARAAEPLAEALKSDDWLLRRAAAESLGQIAHPSSVTPLMAALTDEYESVAMTAAFSLSQIGAPAAEPLLKGLDRQEPVVRQACTYALGMMKERRAVPAIRPLLADSQPATVRLAAAEALSRLGDADSAGAVVALLKDLTLAPPPSRTKPTRPPPRRGKKDGPPRSIEDSAAEEEDSGKGLLNAIYFTVARLGSAAVPALAELACDPKPAARVAALTALAQIKDDRRIPIFIKALADGDGGVAQTARGSLDRCGSKDKLLGPLLEALKAPETPVRMAALGQLENYRDPACVGPLVERLKDQDAALRARAARMLGALASKAAQEPLAALLADNDAQVRMAAAEGLAELGDARANQVLFPIVQQAAAIKNNIPGSRSLDIAIEAMGRTREKRAVEPLLVLLESGDADVRRGAALALGHIGDARAVEPLMRVVANQHIRIAEPAARALGLLRDRRATDLLIKCAKSHDIGMRINASEALGDLGDPRGFDALIWVVLNTHYQHKWARDNALKAMVKIDPERSVEAFLRIIQATEAHNVNQYTLICKLLGQVGDGRIVAPLLDLLLADLPETRIAAMDAMKAIGPKAVPELIKHLADPSRAKRSIVTLVLAEIKEPAVEPLLNALKDKDPNVRQATAWALGQIADARALDPLLAALNDPNIDARSAVIWALGQCRDKKVVQHLLPMLKDKEAVLRGAAVEALGCIGDASTAEAVIGALKDEQVSVRNAAAIALGMMGDQRAKGPLMSLLNDKDRDVREHAREALNKLNQSEK